MMDASWGYRDGRQQLTAAPLVGKRPRSDYEMPSGHDVSNYYARVDERGGHHVRDTNSINASYDRYLQGGQISPYAGGESTILMSSGLGGNHRVDDPRVTKIGASDPLVAASWTMGMGGGRPEISLPPDATSTLFVEGLPANCTRREVSHIFRPFVGYKESRLVTKESRHRGGDPFVLCFVDFLSPAHAAAALNALQGYKFDEHERDSDHLRLQFARHPGARSGSGHRGKR